MLLFLMAKRLRFMDPATVQQQRETSHQCYMAGGCMSKGRSCIYITGLPDAEVGMALRAIKVQKFTKDMVKVLY